MTYHRFVTRLTRRVPVVEQKLLTLPEHLSSPPVFSVVRITQSLVLYACFVDRCLSVCTFSFDHCVVYLHVCFFDLRILITHLVGSNSSLFDLKLTDYCVNATEYFMWKLFEHGRLIWYTTHVDITCFKLFRLLKHNMPS